MPHNSFSLIRGHNFNRFTDFLTKGAEKIYDATKPIIGTFADAGMKVFEGAVNNQDNWGLFGTILQDKVVKYLTAPDEKVNAALPPTQGSVVRFGPALPPTDETVVIDMTPPGAPIARPITAKKTMTAPDRPPVIEEILPKKKKKSKKDKTSKSKPKAKKTKTVSEMTAPKKKKREKKYRYKAEI